MKIRSDSFTADGPIPDRCAFGKIHPENHFQLSDNRNPHLAWTDPPASTRSFALLCVDPDVPTVGDNVNKEGRTVSKSLPRTDFYHWLMANIPADCRELAEGQCSSAVTPRGKQNPPGPTGSIQGVNNYTDWFAGDPQMKGAYHGYDGPAPPWNDELIHHYIFRILALDIPRLELDDSFTGPDLIAAMKGHILAEAEIIGTYTLNPALR